MPVQSANNTSPGIGMEQEEVNEILGAPPRWIVRWGNLVVLGTVLLLLAVALFIQYPDITYGKASLTPVKKSVPVFIPAGYVANGIQVSDRQPISKGQLLFYVVPPGAPDSAKRAIRAETDGMIVFQRDARAATDTAQPTLLLSIVPRNGLYNATVTVSEYGSGSIQIGQQVVIRLNNYPGPEFGNIIGTIVSRPLPLGGGNVVVSVQLDHGLTTTYHKHLEMYGRGEGTAEIVTAHKRLIRRIFSFF